MILVIAEQRGGKLNRASWEAVAAAQALSDVTGKAPVTVAVVGGDVTAPAGELAAAAVAEVLAAGHGSLAAYTPDAYAAAAQRLVESTSPAWVLLPHTYQTRDFAPTLAARLRRSLITDVTAVGPDATLTRPMFQGKLAAQVRPLGDAPFVVTVQVGAFRADSVRKGAAPAPVRAIELDLNSVEIRQTPEAPFQEAKQSVDLGQAERIVAVGRGIKSQAHIAIAEKLAAAMGAELAASRPICDNGWLPMERQIGSSGQTVAPKLYVALGISGAIQHLVGMKGSRTVVAINKDAEAPIFEVAEYGIVGDLFEIVPALIAELEKTKRD